MGTSDHDYFTSESFKFMMRETAREVLRETPPPSNGGNGMEARIAKLEASVSHIERDISDVKTDVRELRKDISDTKKELWNHFLILGGMIIATALGLAGLMAKGFKWF